MCRFSIHPPHAAYKVHFTEHKSVTLHPTVSNSPLSLLPTPQAAVCRSSQPLSGFSTRSPEDEQMLQAIMKSNPASEYMYVVDTRPKVRAHGNALVCKSYIYTFNI